MTISIFFTLILSIFIFPFTLMNAHQASPKFLMASGILSLTILLTSVVMIVTLFLRVLLLFFWG